MRERPAAVVERRTIRTSARSLVPKKMTRTPAARYPGDEQRILRPGNDRLAGAAKQRRFLVGDAF